MNAHQSILQVHLGPATYKALAAACGYKTPPAKVKELQAIARKLHGAMAEINRASTQKSRYAQEKQVAAVEKLIREEKISEIMPSDFISQEQFRENLRAGLRTIKEGMRGLVGEAAAIAREEIKAFKAAATKYLDDQEAAHKKECDIYAVPYARTYLVAALRLTVDRLDNFVPPEGFKPYATPVESMVPWLDL